MRTLTRADMYDKNGKCILPIGGHKFKPSKYSPHQGEREKRRRKEIA